MFVSFGAFFSTCPLVVWDMGLSFQLISLTGEALFARMLYGALFISILCLAIVGLVRALERGLACLPPRPMWVGLAVYLLGCAMVLLWSGGVIPTSGALGAACGVCLGVGTVALVAFWCVQLASFTVRAALMRLSLACGAFAAVGIGFASGFLPGLPVVFACLVVAGLVYPARVTARAGRRLLIPGEAPQVADGEGGVKRAEDEAEFCETRGGEGLFDRVRPAILTPCLGLFLFVFDSSGRNFVYESYGHISAWSVALGGAVLLLLVSRWRQFSLASIYRVLLPGAAALFIVLSAFPVGSMSFGIGYLVSHVLMGTIALLALASLCGVAHAGEVSPFLIACSLVAMIAIADVLGMCLSAFVDGEDALGATLLVCAITYFVYALVAPLGEYYRLFSGGSEPNEAKEFGVSSDVGDACDELARQALLSAREREILPYLARGHRPAYIAELLCISEHTVRTHIRNIYRKLGVNSTDGLIGLVESRMRP